MRIPIIALIVSALIQPVFSQSYGNIVFGQYLYHSENDEPTTWTKPIVNFYSCDFGYEFYSTGHRLMQIGIGYEENYSPEIASHETDLDYGNRISYNLEQSIPVYTRIAWSSKGMTSYGFGPIYSPAKHTYTIENSFFVPHREVIYSHSLGLTGFARISMSLTNHLFGLLTLEGRYLKGFWFQSGGQDLSNYNFENIQVRLAIGIGMKRG